MATVFVLQESLDFEGGIVYDSKLYSTRERAEKAAIKMVEDGEKTNEWTVFSIFEKEIDFIFDKALEPGVDRWWDEEHDFVHFSVVKTKRGCKIVEYDFNSDTLKWEKVKNKDGKGKRAGKRHASE
jgi:hypothetical protein